MSLVAAPRNIYERNFSRLSDLLPDLFECREVKGEGQSQGLRLEVLEQHKYTTVIRLSHEFSHSSHVSNPVMTVCVYHDARVAEVIAYQHGRRLKPKYDYPNPQMHQKREKQRVNEFLGEWLEHCRLCRNAFYLIPYLSDA